LGFTLTAPAQTLRHSETVLLNGLDTYYEMYGDGPPLFFLHGGGQSVALWQEYVEHFAANYEVYLVDLPGHGKSGAREGKFSYETAIEQIQGLLDHLGLQRISAVGFSLGGEVLLQLAVSDPNRIQRIIVIGTTHHYLPKGPDEIEFLLADESVRSIITETLVVMGEFDEMAGGNPQRSLQLVFRLHELLPNSHLWIVPNDRHNTFNDKGKPEFVRVANEFFGGQFRLRN
jgi:pimeloyl-ACP methyl ester carboxylesterase